MNNEQFEKNLLVFTLLATQSEFYGIALKGKVKHDFNYLLNNYLNSTKQLMKFINEFIEAEALEDKSEEIANFIENLINPNINN